MSWASLDHALGDEEVDRERWAVLAAAKLPAELPAATAGPARGPAATARDTPRNLAAHGLDGILVLDGTWSQAKTLWWRNPWLLKLPRLVLRPREPSMYGRLRREPRREWVSTLEAVADVAARARRTASRRGTAAPAAAHPAAARARCGARGPGRRGTGFRTRSHRGEPLRGTVTLNSARDLPIMAACSLNIPGHSELRKIVVLNPKGGSGKTTVAVNLAAYFAATVARRR